MGCALITFGALPGYLASAPGAPVKAAQPTEGVDLRHPCAPAQKPAHDAERHGFT